MNYFPINCTGTNGGTQCTNPCETDTSRLDADFDLVGVIQKGNTTNYLVSAANFSTTPNSQWIVSNTTLVSPYPDVTTPNTVYASNIGTGWAIATSTGFGGYVGTSSVSTEYNVSSLSFLMNKRYRFKHILTSVNNCGITRSDTVVKTIYMCPGCRNGSGNDMMVETEKASSSGTTRSGASHVPAMKSAEVRIMPNPVNTGTISIEYNNAAPGAVAINIADMQGKTVATKLFTTSVKTMNKYSMDVSTLADGTYTISILNNGKIAVQKIIIAK